MDKSSNMFLAIVVLMGKCQCCILTLGFTLIFYRREESWSNVATLDHVHGGMHMI